MTYDYEGQTTSKGAETYTYNVRHQLETVTGTGYQYKYIYDESGHRVKAVRNGVTTKYIYGSGSQILAEADSNGVIKRYYIYGHGLIGFYVPGTGYFTCHNDMSGNMVAITNDTGAVTAKFSYTPFGEVIDRTITQPVCDIPTGFAGEYGVLREPNGLYYMNARYYDPSTGRFLSEDPAGLGGGDVTLYSYAGNNPVVFMDPSGLCASNSGNLLEDTKLGWKYLLGNLEINGKSHYNRNSFNLYLPENSVINDPSWYKHDASTNRYHLPGQKYTSGNNPFGNYENVYLNGKQLYDPSKMGTYNYGQRGWTHALFDVVPYYFLGNSINDPTNILQRVTK